MATLDYDTPGPPRRYVGLQIFARIVAVFFALISPTALVGGWVDQRLDHTLLGLLFLFQACVFAGGMKLSRRSPD